MTSNGQQGKPNLPEKDNPPAELGRQRLDSPIARTGMFGAKTSGDTSGYGRLRVYRPAPTASERPYSDPDDPRTAYFDEVADTLERSLKEVGASYQDAIRRVVVDRGEITFHVQREHLLDVATRLRDDPALRFELCLGVNGVHYPDDTGNELHAVYEMRSITHNREIRLEVTCPDADPHLPSIVGVYPTNDWHERETWDFFGIVFDGHPGLTRIQMPDDWHGHPQRKDYPLGGIPVEYRGAKVPPPDERRSYA
ncbi:NADH-quinone oxidoreductase subunit C [Thermobifida halotolerans]|uniref:NADH-quinone oxidoreductase subunit C n=1 Tax=Thermobifida halotolerans TaxID=483545 RepID=A0A399FZI5_9ACTN|nr:NADH-quinone oxidoreductase subunit C [Thermobifida halotolerans]UOE18419.1 NADH-quinone oxidoreductase subunit C [Thermobifida halotolerans]